MDRDLIVIIGVKFLNGGWGEDTPHRSLVPIKALESEGGYVTQVFDIDNDDGLFGTDIEDLYTEETGIDVDWFYRDSEITILKVKEVL